MRSPPVLIMDVGAVVAAAAVGIVAAGSAGIVVVVAEGEAAAARMLSRRLADTTQSCMQKALVVHVHRRRRCLVELHYSLQWPRRAEGLPHLQVAFPKTRLLYRSLLPTREASRVAYCALLLASVYWYFAANKRS